MNCQTLPSSECEPVSADTSSSPPEREPLGIYGGPVTPTGTITPLGLRADWDDEDGAWGSGHIWVACGIAASAWAGVDGAPTTAARDVALVLTEDACPLGDWNLAQTFGVEEHELQPARDRIATRLATDPDFTAKFAKARAVMNAACVYFPWYRGDGRIPG